MRIFFLVAAAMFVLTGTVHAQRQSGLTGQKLADMCGGDRAAAENCEAFIDGVADAAYFYQSLRPQNGSKGAPLPAYLCVPPGTTGVRMRDILVQFVQKRADQANREAAGVVLRALDASFPCSNGRK